jgi:hypothetical protein
VIPVDDDPGGFILICSPISAFSPPAEIAAYLKQLRKLPNRPEVRIEIRNTKAALKLAKRLE